MWSCVCVCLSVCVFRGVLRRLGQPICRLSAPRTASSARTATAFAGVRLDRLQFMQSQLAASNRWLSRARDSLPPPPPRPAAEPEAPAAEAPAVGAAAEPAAEPAMEPAAEPAAEPASAAAAEPSAGPTGELAGELAEEMDVDAAAADGGAGADADAGPLSAHAEAATGSEGSVGALSSKAERGEEGGEEEPERGGERLSAAPSQDPVPAYETLEALVAEYEQRMPIRADEAAGELAR